jgi:hypothetical protein
MSTPFYDLASLVVVPSGYKAAKIYAQKPLTTDGQLAFTRASTATRVNASGLVEAVASGVPRLDYLNSTCPKLLLEPQRTNVALNSETFVLNTGTTVTLNNTASPDGFISADKIVEDTSTGTHITNFTGILGGSVDSSPYSVSVFLKAAGRTRVRIFDNNQVSIGDSEFNISTGVVISGTGKIVNYGNGWYRCTIFPLKDFLTTSDCRIQLLNASGSNTYTGDGTSGIFAWGKQTEAGAYATSYIPTLGASVTRVADAASKTGISSLIGQTEGTLFWEMEIFNPASAANEDVILIDNGALSNLIYLTKSTTNAIIADVYVAGVRQAFYITSVLPQGTYKCAFGYANNNMAFFVNGTQIGITDTSCSVPTMSRIMIGTNPLGDSFSRTHQVLLFKTRLTNAQLAELTA